MCVCARNKNASFILLLTETGKWLILNVNDSFKKKKHDMSVSKNKLLFFSYFTNSK